MIDALIQFFTGLPATSQAAIIASLVTLLGAVCAALIALIGILVNHRGNERRFAKQLAYDRELKRIEREMELRRDVYLATADAIVAGLALISRYADLSVTKDELTKDFFEKRSALSKVHLVGKEATVKAILEFTQELGIATLHLASLRNPLLQMKAQLEILDGQMKIFGKERDRMVELMKQLNFEGTQEARRWDFVKNTFEFEQQRVNDCLKQHEALHNKLKKAWTPFAAECFSTLNKLNALLPAAVKAVRDELELPIDFEFYKKAIDENLRRQQEVLSGYLNDINKMA